MRFQFCGKCIVQPQDIVHIYMDSKARFDNKLTTGLRASFEGLSILQDLNNTITDLTDSIKNVFNPSGNLDLQAEKSIFVGSDFDNALWLSIRDQFVNEIEGTHVFAGLVSSAPLKFSNGKYSVSISCEDNLAYLSNGKVNFKPGTDVFNGMIFDPLTPFKSKFDDININSSKNYASDNLLEENRLLLSGKSNFPLVKFKSRTTCRCEIR